MLNTRMLVDAEAVKLRHPSFIIPTMNNSCAVHAWGISSRLPKLFTFQRACGRNHFKITLRQGRKNPVLFKNRPRRNIVSYPKPQSRGKRGGFHFFNGSGKFVTATTATVIVDAPIERRDFAATSSVRPVVKTSSTRTTGFPCNFPHGIGRMFFMLS